MHQRKQVSNSKRLWGDKYEGWSKANWIKHGWSVFSQDIGSASWNAFKWKVKFNTYLKEKIAKANKSIGIICKLAHALPRESLVTIYKSFVRPHIDYGDIIYDQPNNDSFCDMIKRVQYNAALAITGAIKGTSQLKLYKELGFKSLKFRRQFRHLCFYINYEQHNSLSICMILFLKEDVHITPVIRIKLKHIIVKQIYSNTPFVCIR